MGNIELVDNVMLTAVYFFLMTVVAISVCPKDPDRVSDMIKIPLVVLFLLSAIVLTILIPVRIWM